MLGELWKTQSPPVSMETPSLFTGGEAKPFYIRNQGCELFCIITRIVLTTGNNILYKMNITGVVMIMPVNLLKRLKINRVEQTSANENGAWQTYLGNLFIPFLLIMLLY